MTVLSWTGLRNAHLSLDFIVQIRMPGIIFSSKVVVNIWTGWYLARSLTGTVAPDVLDTHLEERREKGVVADGEDVGMFACQCHHRLQVRHFHRRVGRRLYVDHLFVHTRVDALCQLC